MNPTPRPEPQGPTSATAQPSPHAPTPAGPPGLSAASDTEAAFDTAPLAVSTERALAIAEKLSDIVRSLAELSRRYQELQDVHRQAGTKIPGDWSPSVARNTTRSFTKASAYLDDAVATLADARRTAQRMPDPADLIATPPALPHPQGPAPTSTSGASDFAGSRPDRSGTERAVRAQPELPRPQNSSDPEIAL